MWLARMTGWLYMTKWPLWLASLIVSDERGDVIGENDGLVVHDEMTAVGNAHTLPHVGEQQLVEEWSVPNHKVSWQAIHQIK